MQRSFQVRCKGCWIESRAGPTRPMYRIAMVMKRPGQILSACRPAGGTRPTRNSFVGNRRVGPALRRTHSLEIGGWDPPYAYLV